jgi:hypothetical protein
VRLGTWQDRFINSLRRLGNVSRACKAGGVGRETVYAHRKADEAFSARWADALEESADWLEREAWRRAVKGLDKPVFQQGRRVGTVREYSDALLVQLLKANRPEKFRENAKIEHAGLIRTSDTRDLSRLSLAELSTLEAILRKAENADAGGGAGREG